MHDNNKIMFSRFKKRRRIGSKIGWDHFFVNCILFRYLIAIRDSEQVMTKFWKDESEVYFLKRPEIHLSRMFMWMCVFWAEQKARIIFFSVRFLQNIFIWDQARWWCDNSCYFKLRGNWWRELLAAWPFLLKKKFL